MNLAHLINRISKYLFDANYRFSYNASQGMYQDMPDDEYLRRFFKATLGYELNLENPITFNEKIQWLKLNDRKTVYTQMVDKYEAKDYVAKIIGYEHIIPTLGAWEHFEDICFEYLPNQFVLKTTHGCGGIYICKDKSELDIEKARITIMKTFNNNYYYYVREWPYKNVKPRIIAEEYKVSNTDSNGNGELRDYKFFCFNGTVKCFKIDFDRFVEHHANYYDREGKILPFGELDFQPKPERELSIPKELNTMIEYAEQLSKGLRFLRVDFYVVDEKIYFGELTFSPKSGTGRFTPTEWDKKLGDWLEL